MRVLITGATGLVGSYAALRLRDGGWTVRALVRDPAGAAWLAREGVELARGDVLDAPSVGAALAGCDAVVHAAATVVSGGGYEAYRRPNVDGTRHVVDAAAAAGARLAHVSSVAVYGAAGRYGDGRPTDEETPLPPLAAGELYARSKRESEALVLDAHAAGRLWATALRPDVVYGRRDRQFVPRMARVVRRGYVPAVGGGGSTLAVIHAANVAEAIALALGHDGAGGRAYNVANEAPVTVRRFFELAAEGLGRRVRVVRVPAALVHAAAHAAAVGAALAGRGGLSATARSSVAFLTRDNPFSSERARRELGWAPVVAPETGVPDAFRWWAENAGGA